MESARKNTEKARERHKRVIHPAQKEEAVFVQDEIIRLFCGGLVIVLND